ncbi:SpoIID/LytB domain-containing protein, partial [Candidatus Microgenomates bacterium]|nr:SpoIID/LytB domain-containing protein [Candidatus Microgenomates bacterium]
MRFPFLLGLLTLVFSLIFLAVSSPVRGDELEEITEKLKELTKARELSISATRPLEQRQNVLGKQLLDIKLRVDAIEADLVKKKKDLESAESQISNKQEELVFRVRKAYIRSYLDIPILTFFSQEEAVSLTRDLAYRRAQTDRDKEQITILALWIKDLEERRSKLESENVRLIAVKAKVDEESNFLKKEIAGAKSYQSQLSSQIAQLSARQQSIIAAKLGSLNLPTSLGAGPLFCTDDRDSKFDPGFRPAFAFFTYGIPHRVGMNQYGAYGRAKAGQGYQDILRAYFDGISFEKKDNITINVDGYGAMPLEQYLLGIYEMPGDWPMEALKAQVIAARSYALAYTGNGARSICTSQQCQVYKGGNKGGNWEQAVRATEGEAMVRDGGVITAWYASTSGGYTFTSADVGWSPRSWTKRLRDTTGDIGGFSDLKDKAYDRDSPCFYSAQGFRAQYNKSAWLKSEEVADIVNV